MATASCVVAPCTVNLATYVDTEHVHVVNGCRRANEYLRGILSDVRTGTSALTSDKESDHQMIIVVPFLEAVKVRSMRVNFVKSQRGSDEESGPKDVHIFIDRPNYSFQDVDGAAAVQDLSIQPRQLETTTGEGVALKFVKFQNVHALTLFIETNQDDSDVTAIHSLQFWGEPIAGTDMKNLKKTG